MEVESGRPEDEQELLNETVENLKEKEEIIRKNKGLIESSFETSAKNQSIPGGLTDSLEVIFHSEFESQDEKWELISGLIAAVTNLDRVYLEEMEGYLDEEIINFLKSLSVRFSEDIDRSFKEENLGEDVWDSVKTEISYRNDSLLFRHEIDKLEGKVSVNSAIEGELRLVNHILTQVLDSTGLVGEDVLDMINEESLEDIEDKLDRLRNKVDEYQDED